MACPFTMAFTFRGQRRPKLKRINNSYKSPPLELPLSHSSLSKRRENHPHHDIPSIGRGNTNNPRAYAAVPIRLCRSKITSALKVTLIAHSPPSYLQTIRREDPQEIPCDPKPPSILHLGSEHPSRRFRGGARRPG